MLTFVAPKDGVFVRELHQDGAAAKSGRLRVGERILTVDGRECADLTQKEVVSTLRLEKEKARLSQAPRRKSLFCDDSNNLLL